MNRMYLVVALVAVALGLAGLLAVRHAARTQLPAPPASDLRAPPRKKPTQPLDTWQGKLPVDPRTDYAPDPAAADRLREKLRQEELRQRPQEGRN